MIMNPLIAAAVHAGYQVSPNNIHRLPGVELFPSGPGVLEMPYGFSVHAEPDRYVVRRQVVTPLDRDSTVVVFTHPEVEAFTEFPALLTYLQAHGKPSLGGMPGFSNAWD